jgi:transcriptional regulator with PAS, ATPase and Fis domain
LNKDTWFQGFPSAIIVSDANGTLIDMNAKAAEILAQDGGNQLIGSDIFECHPKPARTKLKELYTTCQTNVYTIEKNGIKKLIYQSPWYNEGKFAGYVELSLDIPFDMPHFIRE